MKPSALRMAKRNENILKGFWVLIPVVLVLFLFRISGINSARETTGSNGDFFVHLEGDIKYPGVYVFDNQSNIRELIELGGGITSVTDETMYKTDIPVHSGSKITVQTDHNSCVFIHGEMSSFHKITLSVPISINMETEEGLTAIPGIGPKLASSIVKARIKQGGFKALEDLISVPGIGGKTYKKIISYVTL